MSLIAYEPAASCSEAFPFCSGHAPDDRIRPLIRLTDGNDYAVMTRKLASIHVCPLGAEFCEAAQYSTQIKAAIEFPFDGV